MTNRIDSRISKLMRCVLVLACSAPAALAQVDDLRMPVDIDAEKLKYVGNTSMIEFTGLKLTQGGISITADVGHATSTDFNDSNWNFSGHVVFDINEGHIECDSADMEFSNFQLKLATIQGTPATFRFQRPGATEPTYAEARKLHYDVPAGVIEFSGDARINEGGNRIASESLVYNILERRVSAVSSGDPEDRVKVTYTPPADDDDGATAGGGGGGEDSGTTESNGGRDDAE